MFSWAGRNMMINHFVLTSVPWPPGDSKLTGPGGQLSIEIFSVPANQHWASDRKAASLSGPSVEIRKSPRFCLFTLEYTTDLSIGIALHLVRLIIYEFRLTSNPCRDRIVDGIPGNFETRCDSLSNIFPQPC